MYSQNSCHYTLHACLHQLWSIICAVSVILWAFCCTSASKCKLDEVHILYTLYHGLKHLLSYVLYIVHVNVEVMMHLQYIVQSLYTAGCIYCNSPLTVNKGSPSIQKPIQSLHVTAQALTSHGNESLYFDISCCWQGPETILCFSDDSCTIQAAMFPWWQTDQFNEKKKLVYICLLYACVWKKKWGGSDLQMYSRREEMSIIMQRVGLPLNVLIRPPVKRGVILQGEGGIRMSLTLNKTREGGC